MTRGQNIIGISATRGSAILGLNSWKTPLLAWQELMEKKKPGFNAERGFILPEREDKAVFRWGNAFESAVVELAESAQNDSIKDLEKYSAKVFKKIKPMPFCYLDGVYQSTERGLILHEGKTTFERAFYKSWGEPGTDRVPEHIQIQVQHQMMCTNADECIVSVLVFPFDVEEREEAGWSVVKTNYPNGSEYYRLGNDKTGDTKLPRQWADTLNDLGYFHQYPVATAPDVQQSMREVYEDFWGRYVIPEVAPACTDYDDVKRLFTAPKGELIIPDYMVDRCAEYKAIGKEIGAGGDLKKRQIQLKTEIVSFLRDKTTVESDDAQERVVCLDSEGNKVGSFNSKGIFRA